MGNSNSVDLIDEEESHSTQLICPNNEHEGFLVVSVDDQHVVHLVYHGLETESSTSAINWVAEVVARLCSEHPDGCRDFNPQTSNMQSSYMLIPSGIPHRRRRSLYYWTNFTPNNQTNSSSMHLFQQTVIHRPRQDANIWRISLSPFELPGESFRQSLVQGIPQIRLEGQGMHRTLYTRVQFSNRSISTSLSMVQIVPKDWFFDVDMPSPHMPHFGCNSCQITISTAGTMDIEQPAFASSMTALYYDIHVISHATQFIEFATSLHLRYPSPSQQRYSKVILQAPFIMGKTTGPILPNSNTTIHTTVPSGVTSDYDFVMATTIFAVMTGTSILMRAIIHASKWWFITWSSCMRYVHESIYRFNLQKAHKLDFMLFQVNGDS